MMTIIKFLLVNKNATCKKQFKKTMLNYEDDFCIKQASSFLVPFYRLYFLHLLYFLYFLFYIICYNKHIKQNLTVLS